VANTVSKKSPLFHRSFSSHLFFYLLHRLPRTLRPGLPPQLPGLHNVQHHRVKSAMSLLGKQEQRALDKSKVRVVMK
jgi:hypothetical protein